MILIIEDHGMFFDNHGINSEATKQFSESILSGICPESRELLRLYIVSVKRLQSGSIF